MRQRVRCLAAATVVAFAVMPASAAAQIRCGGTERWFVKTGIDPDASLVGVSNAIPATIGELNALPSLRDTVPKGDNQARLTEERMVYKVSGRLVLFKYEDDNDYHLVITDDSLRYTPGGQGTAGLETGTSFIAEIPDPQCVAGKKGPSGATSQWQEKLVSARGVFEARFPGAQGADTDLGGIPVTLTGVLFYDRQHLQTGRAVNGVELHPILEISFEAGPPAPPTPTPTPPEEQLLANSGFEDGVTGWSGTVDDIGTYEGESAHTGSFFAWMGGLGRAHSETLYQNVSIPASAKRVELSLWLAVQTEETSKTRANDKLYVQLRDNNSRVVKTLEVFSNLHSAPNYIKHTYDVSAYAGGDYQVFLRIVEDNGKATSFKVDDIALSVY